MTKATRPARALCSLALLIAAFAIVPSTSAAPLVREHYSGVDTGS